MWNNLFLNVLRQHCTIARSLYAGRLFLNFEACGDNFLTENKQFLRCHTKFIENAYEILSEFNWVTILKLYKHYVLALYKSEVPATQQI